MLCRDLCDAALALTLKLSVGVLDVVRLHGKAQNDKIRAGRLNPFAFTVTSVRIHGSDVLLVNGVMKHALARLKSEPSRSFMMDALSLSWS